MNPTNIRNREYETNDLLLALSSWFLENVDREAITWSEMQDLFRSEPFFYEDPRTHRNKRKLLEGRGLVARANKTSYRLTDIAYARIRKLKGVPEPDEDGPYASNSVEVEDVDIPAGRSTVTIPRQEYERIRRLLSTIEAGGVR